jgi:hypothetical protein
MTRRGNDGEVTGERLAYLDLEPLLKLNHFLAGLPGMGACTGSPAPALEPSNAPGRYADVGVAGSLSAAAAPWKQCMHRA